MMFHCCRLKHAVIEFTSTIPIVFVYFNSVGFVAYEFYNIIKVVHTVRTSQLHTDPHSARTHMNIQNNPTIGYTKQGVFSTN